MTEATAEICNLCGRSVKQGSPWFENRALADSKAWKMVWINARGVPYPEGAWQCAECADETGIFEGLGYFPRYEIVERLQGRLGRVPTPEETDSCVEYLTEDNDDLAEKFGTMVDERILAWVRDHKPQGQ